MDLPTRDKSNEITSGVLHLVGAVSSVALLVIMIIFASLYGTAWHVVGFTIYGSFMILLYLSSTLYHLIPSRKVLAKDIFQRIDHAIIYLFIAATYTPVCFIALSGTDRWLVFFLLWGLATLGAVLKLCRIRTHYVVPILLYLSMGWMIIFFLKKIIHTMDTPSFVFMVLGGLSYTIGVLFFVLESKLPQRKYFWMHEIFHVFVLGGTTFHTIMMFFLL